MRRSFSLALLGSVLPSALALPKATPQVDMHVTWDHQKSKDAGASKIFLQVWNADRSALLGQLCTDFDSPHVIDTGNFATMPLSMEVEENGFGTLTYGDETYQVHSNPDISGGITCTKKYSDNDAHVDCLVPWKGLFQASELPKAGAQECFGRREQKRQTSGMECQLKSYTELVDDGDPHQKFYHMQITVSINGRLAALKKSSDVTNKAIQEPNTCATESCTAEYESSNTFTFGVSASVSPFEWISGGFNVEQSTTTGQNFACYGGSYDKVCVWYTTSYTEYTVRNRVDVPAYPPLCEALMAPQYPSISEPFAISSPNTDNTGGGYYCVIGDECTVTGSDFWLTADEQAVVDAAMEFQDWAEELEEYVAQASGVPDSRRL
ncbi:hypothetical protein FQN54_006001 [Arachnomyces sp. PD_36]|nr:hypothetical protein FQN54_006001 [Arachnomyces sp. PD_36]